MLWTSIGAMLWSIWLTRNKFTIEGTFPSHPAKCSILLQQWSPLAKQKDTDLMKLAQVRVHQVFVAAREPAMPT